MMITTATSSLPQNKTFRLRGILIFMVLCMVATAIYMTIVIKTVPKTIANSKAGLFGEMVYDLIDVYDHGTGLKPTTDYAAINGVLKKKFQESPWGLRSSETWTLDSWSDAVIHKRPMTLAHYKDAAGRTLLLVVIPISKRNFPRTGGFNYKDAWFMTFGHDNSELKIDTNDAHYTPLVENIEAVHALSEHGLNLVVTNYGNDFFIVMLSPVDSKALAKDLFAMSSIYEVSPQ